MIVDLKKSKLNILAFVCFYLGLSAIQISYIFHGIRNLDLGVLLLVPAFLFFGLWLLQEWVVETKDYAVGFLLLSFAVITALTSKYKFQVGTIDDSYHTIKVICYSINNGFLAINQANSVRPEGRLYLMGLIESVWGLSWRYIHWDYIIVLIQILPVFVLWRQLVDFFRSRDVEGSPGFLAAIIVLSMQIIWAQAGSTYIDSLTGIIAAITLLRIDALLRCPPSRYFYNIATTGFLSALCLLPKPSLIPLGLLGLGVSFWFAGGLNKKEGFITVLLTLPSLAYFVAHYVLIRSYKGTIFYAPGTANGMFTSVAGHGETGQLIGEGYYTQNYFCHFKPLYVFASWLNDYRLGWVTPAPIDIGNGLLWTYLVVPILVIALIVSIGRIPKIKYFHPTAILFIFFLLYYYFLDISVCFRFMLGFHIFIMAWSLAWIMGYIKIRAWVIPPWFKMTMASFMLTLAVLSFFQAIKGALLESKVVSVLQAQRELFPKYINASTFQHQYCTMLLSEDKGRPLSVAESFLVEKCQILDDPPAKDRKLRKQDYHFDDVKRQYDSLGLKNDGIPRSSFSNIKSIKGSILDPENKNGVWTVVSALYVYLKIHIKEDDVKRIAGKDFDKIWPLLEEAGNK